jgi:hypothetical protein
VDTNTLLNCIDDYTITRMRNGFLVFIGNPYRREYQGADMFAGAYVAKDMAEVCTILKRLVANKPVA